MSRTLLRLILAVPLLACLGVAEPLPASACSIASPPPGATATPTLDEQDRIAAATVRTLLSDSRLLVFQAYADLTTFNSYQIPVQSTYTLTVTKRWRGSIPAQMTYTDRSPCGGSPFVSKEEYVIFAYGTAEGITDVWRGATRPVSQAAYVLQELGPGVAVTPAARPMTKPTLVTSVPSTSPSQGNTTASAVPAPLLLVGIGGISLVVVSVLFGMAFALRRL